MKLIIQFIRAALEIMCAATILLLIIDVTGALIISTLAAKMAQSGHIGRFF